MALELRRRTGRFTRENLPNRSPDCHWDLLSAGADSFKRIRRLANYAQWPWLQGGAMPFIRA